MEKSFYSDERGEDLLKWCTNLDALGDVISYMAWANDGDECFNRSGGCLGVIISDYASAIYETLAEIHWEASEILEDYDGSKIGHLKRKAKLLKEHGHPHLGAHLGNIDEVLKEFKPVFDDVIGLNSELIRMRKQTEKELKKAKEEAGNKFHELQQERALAGVDTEAKAPEEEGQQPDSESTLAQQGQGGNLEDIVLPTEPH